MQIAVAGGTGAVGREVVRAAQARGHGVRVIARSHGADVITGSGLAEAMDGAHALIDTVSVDTLNAQRSIEFFDAASARLLAQAERSGVGRLVVLSIVGIDLNPHGYYAGKLAQERAYARNPHATVLRATQFHEFADQVAARARLGPVQLAPRARVQPVAATAVAERLVSLAEEEPQGRAIDIAGPREEELSEMIRASARHQGRRGPVWRVSLPTAQMRGMRRGFALPSREAELVGPTFAQWLAQRPVPA